MNERVGDREVDGVEFEAAAIVAVDIDRVRDERALRMSGEREALSVLDRRVRQRNCREGIGRAVHAEDFDRRRTVGDAGPVEHEAVDGQNGLERSGAGDDETGSRAHSFEHRASDSDHRRNEVDIADHRRRDRDGFGIGAAEDDDRFAAVDRRRIERLLNGTERHRKRARSRVAAASRARVVDVVLRRLVGADAGGDVAIAAAAVPVCFARRACVRRQVAGLMHRLALILHEALHASARWAAQRRRRVVHRAVGRHALRRA